VTRPRNTRLSLQLSALAAFVFAAAAPLLLWHHSIEAMAGDFRLNAGYIVTGWSGYILIVSGLVLMLPVLVSVGLGPDSRLYPRSRNVFIGWGTSLYLLGTMLASIVGSAVG
jgi:hypothetical protein